MHVAVVAAGNGIAEARALARSLARHHPDWPMTVVVMPGLRPELHREGEPFDVLVPGDLVEGTLVDSAPQAALAAALQARLVAQLLERGAEQVLALPSDAYAYAPLTALERALEEHEAVLVPRLTGTLPDDGKRPDGRDLLQAGELDDTIAAVRAPSTFAQWWVDRTLEAAQAGGAPVNPFAAALKVFPALGRLEDARYGVSHWNLQERSLDDVALMRWDGFRPDRPWWLSEHATRHLVLDDPKLTALVGERVEALRAGGWIRLDGLATGVGELPNGLRYDARLQALRAQASDAGEDFGDVFSPTGAEAFETWLLEPAPAGAKAGINRYAYDVWRERPDVQEAYPDLDGPDVEGYLGWLWVHGRPEMALQGSLLPSPPEGVADSEGHVPPVLVAGYLRGNLGLGEAARGYVAALRHGGVPVATRSISVDPPVDRLPRGARPRPMERAFAELTLPDGLKPEVNLLGVNADQTPELLDELEEPRGDYNIGLWAWETDKVPERWDRPFDLVDELWVYSTYIAEHLARAGDVPVIVMPLPVAAPDPGGATVPFAIPDGFVFLFAFDFFSTLQRKNPLGLVEAFKQAFAPGEGPTLLLKTINAEFRPAERERLRYAIGDRSDIQLTDTTLTPAEMAALFARADCYVSLHRSEGYGLTLAESMALGKPVIGTGFSGNTDFMTPSNSYLVDWTLTDVGPDAEHYPADGTWAEPSLEHAAALLREVYTDQETARLRGARAAADIAATLSVAEVGRKARERLMRIAARRRSQPAVASAPHAELAGRLHFDLSGRREGVDGARGAVRRGVFRALAPYTSSQRQLDVALAETLQRMHVELEAERAALARERQRAARRDRRLGELAERLGSVERRVEPVRRELPSARAIRELRDAARAIPYTEGEPFSVYDHPVAGRVQGFKRDSAAEVGSGEAYRAFEDVFRGTRERVRELAAPYVELLRDHAPVLDAGCGRGELLELLRDAGIEARGVDLDAGMAEEARALGLDVTVGDALSYLEALEDDSLGAIVSMQVIEHIPRDRLARFFALGRAKVRPGGLFVAETVNPHAGHALKTFWVDLTHQHPIFPEVALALAGDAGFAEAFITHLAGKRDVDRDRFAESSYAIVATA